MNFLRRLIFHFLYRFHAKKIRDGEKIELMNFVLDVPPTVFHPKLYFTSVFFGEYIRSLNLKNKIILDMGCGSGILSLIAASNGAYVTSVDINPRAVEATTINVEQNKLSDRIHTFQSDLFKNIPRESRFDVILFNPPYYLEEPTNDQERAFFGGDDYRVMNEFAQQVKSFLSKDGVIYIILTSDVDEKKILSFFDGRVWKTTPVKSKRILFERLTIYSITVGVES